MEVEAAAAAAAAGGGGGGGGGGDTKSIPLLLSNGGVNAVSDDGNRPPRLPRWTRQEILVLIQGKMVAENRVRRGRNSGSAFGSSNQQIEPKWNSVSSYCKRHGVNRGPVQCRKRWSNLAGDFRKIKEWESQISEESESFWGMRNDLRRDKKLPGFFDREVYDVLDGGPVTPNETTMVVTALAAAAAGEEPKEKLVISVKEEEVEEIEEEEGEEEEAVFDSGRSAAANDALFEETTPTRTPLMNVQAPLPISEKQYEPIGNKGGHSDKGTMNEKLPATNPDKGSTSQEGRKRRRMLSHEDGNISVEDQLIKVLENNSRMLTAQLDAQNTNFQLDRDQRKDHSDSIVAVLSKLADALGRIADKL